MIAVAVLTLGAISPNHMIWENLLEDKAPSNSQAAEGNEKLYTYDFLDPSELYYSSQSVLETVHKAAEEQAYLKFGSRIGPVIQDEFQTSILPNIQQAINDHLSGLDPDKQRLLAISERPSGDHAEKIFHVYNSETSKDLIRFHVRTEKKPLEGYFFNFHYHV